VPRAQYTKPPGPLPAPEQIRRSEFRLRNDQWRELAKLLPCKLAGLAIQPDDAARLPAKLKTIADVAIQATEDDINSYLTGLPLVSEGRLNPANVRAAIRRLREALKPFAQGSVDDETADIIPADLDGKLEARDQAIAKLRLPPTQRRALGMLCQHIVSFVRQLASANGETISEQDMLCYVDAALSFARIGHPNISKHRDRFMRLCFSNDSSPQSMG
jgi:hypothetical protein